MTLTRFAPSPTGYLHEGHAFSALFALKQGTRFLLRLEDIDRQRCRPAFEEALLEDLSWLSFKWEEPVRRQSDHFADYQGALDQLGERGLLYPCFCTRQDIARAGGAPQGDYGPLYGGTCRALSVEEQTRRMAEGEAYALRLDIAKALTQINKPLRFHDKARGWIEANPLAHGDVVLARSLRGVAGAPGAFMPASYHLCVTWDDALQEIDLVTRGDDLLPSTDIHVLLQALLNLPTPAYHHHPLLRDASGKRLAKRDNAPALRELRESGVKAEEIMARLELRLKELL